MQRLDSLDLSTLRSFREVLFEGAIDKGGRNKNIDYSTSEIRLMNLDDAPYMIDQLFIKVVNDYVEDLTTRLFPTAKPSQITIGISHEALKEESVYIHLNHGTSPGEAVTRLFEKFSLYNNAFVINNKTLEINVWCKS